MDQQNKMYIDLHLLILKNDVFIIFLINMHNIVYMIHKGVGPGISSAPRGLVISCGHIKVSHMIENRTFQ